MKERIVLFPYTYDSKILYENRELGQKEIKLLPFKEQKEIVKEDIIEITEVNQKDSMVICDNIHQFKLEPYIEKIEKCIKNGQMVYVTPLMKRVLQKEFPEKEVFLNAAQILEENCIIKKGNLVKKTISVPIITCVGINENSDKFLMEIETYKKFTENGCKCSVISSNSLGMILGFHVIPEFMYDEQLNLEQKIFCFNHFVKSIVDEEEPDVLIIGIPGAILPMNKYITNHFSEVALAIGNAVEADAAIMTLNYVKEMNKEFLDELCNLAKYKLNMPIEIFAISSQRISFNSEDRALDVLYLEKEFVEKEKLQIKDGIEKPIFYVIDQQGREKGIGYLMNILSGNIEAI